MHRGLSSQGVPITEEVAEALQQQQQHAMSTEHAAAMADYMQGMGGSFIPEVYNDEDDELQEGVGNLDQQPELTAQQQKMLEHSNQQAQAAQREFGNEWGDGSQSKDTQSEPTGGLFGMFCQHCWIAQE